MQHFDIKVSEDRSDELGCSKPPPTLLSVFRSRTCQDDCDVECAQPSAALWNETESRAAVVGTAQENQCVHRTELCFALVLRRGDVPI
jgi:hypothetical protein